MLLWTSYFIFLSLALFVNWLIIQIFTNLNQFMINSTLETMLEI